MANRTNQLGQQTGQTVTARFKLPADLGGGGVRGHLMLKDQGIQIGVSLSAQKGGEKDFEFPGLLVLVLVWSKFNRCVIL